MQEVSIPAIPLPVLAEDDPIDFPRVNMISYDCLPDMYVHRKNPVMTSLPIEDN